MSFSADTAIRIDDVNPAGVYFFTHALATYHHVHIVYLGNLQAEAWRGSRPRPDKPNKSLVQVYRLFGFHPQGDPAGCHSRPQTMCVGFPSPPRRVNLRLVHRATVPSLSQAHLYRVPLGRLLTLPTNTRNYLQLLDRDQVD